MKQKQLNKTRLKKPCKKLKYCPYGELVEQMPLGPRQNRETCKLFGHFCPVYQHHEEVTEDKKLEVLRKINRPKQDIPSLKLIHRRPKTTTLRLNLDAQHLLDDL